MCSDASGATLENGPNSRDLDEIVVTATRRESQLRSVPASVYVLTENDLKRLGAVAFSDYARAVPGLSYSDGGTGGEKQTIRGISNNPWFELNSGTAIHFDEVPITTAGGGVGPAFNPNPALIDIARIEVLRGPQGTLFGAGSMGGAIRIITHAPDPQQRLVSLSTTLTHTADGEPGFGMHGIFNLPIQEDRSALRAIAYLHDTGGFIDNDFDGRDDVNNREIHGARLTGRFAIGDDATLTARVAHQKRTSDGLAHEEPAVGKRQQSRNGEYIEDEWTIYNLTFDVDLGMGNLVSSTSYFDRTVGNSADLRPVLNLFFGLNNPLNVVNREGVGEFVQEIRLVSRDDAELNWLVGAFYQDQSQDVSQDFPSPGFDSLTGGLASMFGQPDNLFVRRDMNSLEQIALYGEVAWRLSDNFEVSAGGRWFDIDRRYAGNNSGLLFVMGQVLESSTASDTGAIPRLGFNFTPTERWSVYGTISEGFRPGGINEAASLMQPACSVELQALGFTSLPSSYDSDSLTNFEVGTRIISANGRTRASVAVYHIDWSEMQTSRLLNCGAGFTENAGKADSDGIEFELRSQPSDRIGVAVAAGYAVAELAEDVPNLNGARGDRLPGVPQLTANASTSYFLREVRGMTPYLGLDLNFVGNSYMEFDSASSPELPSFLVANIRAGIDADSWSAAFFVNNLADKNGKLFVNDNVFGQYNSQIRPRTIGITLSWRF